MFDIPSIRLGRVFGIPIEVNLSWVVIFVLVASSLGGQWFPAVAAAANDSAWMHYLVGAVTALLFFASILAHELSHSLVARAEGSRVDKITLFIFGGVAQMDEEPTTPGREFLMASAGPGMSLVISLVCFIGFTVTSAMGTPWWVWAPLQYLAAVNFFVAVFNLLPGFPLDGGRVLRSILWAVTKDLLKATRWAVRAGQFIGWSMVTFAVMNALNSNLSYVWLGLIGWFIASLAGQAYRQQIVRSATAGVSVASIMTPVPEYVDGSSSLETLVNDHLLGSRHSRYPVMHDGSIVGLITLPDVKTIDRADWPFTSVLQVTNRDTPALVIEHDSNVDAALSRLSGTKPGALLVVREGTLVGIVTRADVIDLINRRGQG